MQKNDEVELCFDNIRHGGWDWFVTLKFPQEPSQKHKGRRAKNAEVAFLWWYDELSSPNCKDSFDGYFRATEKRENGDVLFHVLLRGPAAAYFQKHWRWRWFEGSAGSARQRPVDEKIERLFKYFFYKVHCDIDCYILGDRTGLQADSYAPPK